MVSMAIVVMFLALVMKMLFCMLMVVCIVTHIHTNGTGKACNCVKRKYK